MNPIIDFLKQTEGTVFVNEDGLKDSFKLRPPMTEQEILAFEAGLTFPLPEEMRELLRFAKGFEGVLDDGVDFADAVGFGHEEIFPHARSLAADGYGNFWIVDLTRESKSFGPIFYACHDAPVIVYQTDGYGGRKYDQRYNAFEERLIRSKQQCQGKNPRSSDYNF